MEKIAKLLQDHRQHQAIIKTQKITFLGVDQEDVYNISRPLVWKGKTYLAGRVEPRDQEISRVVFFEAIDDATYRATPYQLPFLQDPYIAVIDGQLMIGGTEIFADATRQITHWHTSFYQGSGLDSFKKVLSAPRQMKDVRLFQDYRGIHIFTRPQGEKAGLGKIGYTFAPKLSDITTELIEQAPIIPGQFGDLTWGGVNDVLLLKNGWIGILGHIAMMSETQVRHYYGMTFAFNPKTQVATPLKIICERRDFAPGASKRPDLVDVVFAGGIIRHANHLATLYVGLSDAEGHYALMKDPFLEYERLMPV